MNAKPPKIVDIGADRDLALRAIPLDPMATDIDSGRAILDDLLIEFADYLPQFD